MDSLVYARDCKVSESENIHEVFEALAGDAY